MKERIVILGGGESGIGAALLATVKGYDVFVSDNGMIPLKHKKTLDEHGIEYEEGNHTEDRIFNAKEVIKSPGIPDAAHLIVQLKEKHIPVISEIEFALRHSGAKIVGITGTNGKTTTTLLTYHILKECGLDVGLAGNVGHSLARQVAERDRAYFVVELSSFQLDGMFDSKIDIAILLNITPDHLDRYNNDFSKYVDSKFRIIQNMQPRDHFIYHEDDPGIASRINDNEISAIAEPISVSKSETASAYLAGQSLIFRDGKTSRKIASDALPIRGKHNMINAMAAIRAAMDLEVDWASISKALKTFKNIPHRLEYAGSIRGVDFFNDSKATNVDAVWYALDSFDSPVVLIIGGKDKGNDYAQLDGLVRQKVKSIVALGIDNSKIESHFSRVVSDITTTDSMFRAVEIAFSKAEEEDVVLLSPACASFDLFKNYEERGEKFKEAVHALKTNIENNLMMAI